MSVRSESLVTLNGGATVLLSLTTAQWYGRRCLACGSRDVAVVVGWTAAGQVRSCRACNAALEPTR